MDLHPLALGVLLFVFVLCLIRLARPAPPNVHQLYHQGQLDLALSALGRGLGLHVHVTHFNLVVAFLTAAGRYREALRWANAFTPSGSPEDPFVPINAAEAAFNLGQWAEAEALLDSVDPLPVNAWVLPPLACQRAWICAHWGLGAEALALVDGVSIEVMFPPYRSEWHFTRAVALSALGRHGEAIAAVDAGAAVAVRASSVRNARSLRGRLLMDAGRHTEAEVELRAAADHPYRWQGGDGLLALALLLRQTGRAEESVAWLQRVLAQDPESEAAQFAAAILEVPPPPPFPSRYPETDALPRETAG